MWACSLRAQPALSSIDMGGMEDIDMGGMDIAMGSTTSLSITAGDISPSISPSGVLSFLLRV